MSVPSGYAFSTPIMATFFPEATIRRTSSEVSASSIRSGAISSVSRWMASNLSMAFS